MDGTLRELRQTELSVDSVMASACLPLVFRAVEIDGEAYWDGGYLGNPSLMSLIAESPAHDLLLVQINPARRAAHHPAGNCDRLHLIGYSAAQNWLDRSFTHLGRRSTLDLAHYLDG